MNSEIILLFSLLCVSLITLVLTVIQLVRRSNVNKETIRTITEHEINDLRHDLDGTIRIFDDSARKNAESIGGMLREGQNVSARAQEHQITQLREEMKCSQAELHESVTRSIAIMNESMEQQQKQMRESMTAQMAEFRNAVTEQIKGLDGRFEQMRDANVRSLETMHRNVNENMTVMREENARKLEEIRETVDEKLQSTLEKRIGESFRSVSEQLEKVYKGLGEMQTLANDVGGLKKVLSGVKTRGILGEVRLGAILEEILSPDQYDTNVATIPGSKDRVEFAVKLPSGDNGHIYLPIDSKFPGERYQQLLDAKSEGDKAAIDAAYKELSKVIISEAKDIAEKYICVPYTTAFGIMFLPFEGLYAEVISRGLLEKLQRDYNINITGPSTLAALLNSLQMGFRTLAIQKHSHEIFDVLVNVQNEFDKFGDVMQKMQKHLRETTGDLDQLMGTRSNTIRRQLDKVQSMDDMAAVHLPADLSPHVPKQ